VLSRFFSLVLSSLLENFGEFRKFTGSKVPLLSAEWTSPSRGEIHAKYRLKGAKNEKRHKIQKGWDLIDFWASTSRRLLGILARGTLLSPNAFL